MILTSGLDCEHLHRRYRVEFHPLCHSYSKQLGHHLWSLAPVEFCKHQWLSIYLKILYAAGKKKNSRNYKKKPGATQVYQVSKN